MIKGEGVCFIGEEGGSSLGDRERRRVVEREREKRLFFS